MKFTVRETIGMPSLGLKKAIIDAIEEVTSNNEHKTPQLKIVFRSALDTEKWFITKWFNLRGYKGNAPDYELNANGQRKEDPSKTEACFDMLGKFAFRAGLDAKENTDIQELIGCTLGIMVEPHDNDASKKQVTDTYSVAKFNELQPA